MIDKKDIVIYNELFSKTKYPWQKQNRCCFYATKSNLKKTAGVDISDCAKKADLPSLKSDINKLDIDELEKVTGSLSNLKSKIRKLDI